jgi:5-methylcytosine-specific restriction protein A
MKKINITNFNEDVVKNMHHVKYKKFYNQLLDNFFEDRKLDRNFLISVLQNPNTPKNILEEYLKNDEKLNELLEKNKENSKTLDLILKNYIKMFSNIDLDKLKEMSESNFYCDRVVVANNLNTPNNILENLSKDENKMVRKFVASNPNTSGNILENLIKDEEVSIRREVAINPNTPIGVLGFIYEEEEDPDVLLSLMSNKELPEELIDLIGDLKYIDLINNIFLENRIYWPDKYKDTLSLSKNQDVLHAFSVKILKSKKDRDLLQHLAENENLSDKTFNYLIDEMNNNTDRSLLVRSNLAGNPNLSSELIEKLYLKTTDRKGRDIWGDDDIYSLIKLPLLAHKNASANFLLQVSEKEFRDDVDMAIVNNENSTLEILEFIALKETTPIFLKKIIAENKNCSLELIKKMEITDYNKKDENIIEEDNSFSNEEMLSDYIVNSEEAFHLTIENLSVVINEDIKSDIESEEFLEGNIKLVEKNEYERNKKAREACLKHFGYDCKVCGFNFEKFYGEIGKNFIEVHHIIPIASIGESYKIDPLTDLVPLCSNCHSIIHRSKVASSVEFLRGLLQDK